MTQTLMVRGMAYHLSGRYQVDEQAEEGPGAKHTLRCNTGGK
jgi:hypothetical protein